MNVLCKFDIKQSHLCQFMHSICDVKAYYRKIPHPLSPLANTYAIDLLVAKVTETASSADFRVSE